LKDADSTLAIEASRHNRFGVECWRRRSRDWFRDDHDDTSTNFLNVHEWAYGATEAVHILSLAVGIGPIALVDLRPLGVGTNGRAERLWRRLRSQPAGSRRL
jgi:hypothetical protein